VPSSRSQYASTRILATIQSCWLCQNLYVCTSILVFHRVLICADRIVFTFAIVVIDVIVVITQRFQARRGADVSVKSHQLKICLCLALRTNSWKLWFPRPLLRRICYSICSHSYSVISIQNRQSELVIAVTQIYGGKVVRREDGALSVQHKRSATCWKKHSTNTEFSRHLVELFKFTYINCL